MDQNKYKELVSEGRANIINGIIAYGLAFEVLEEDEIESELVETLDYALQAIEAMMPALKNLYELDKKMSKTDKSFVEWIQEYMEKRGA